MPRNQLPSPVHSVSSHPLPLLSTDISSFPINPNPNLVPFFHLLMLHFQQSVLSSPFLICFISSSAAIYFHYASLFSFTDSALLMVFDLQNVKLNKFVEYGLGFCISTLKRLRQKSERIEDFDLLARAKECPEEYLSVQICHPPISFMRAKECPYFHDIV
ncbi:hypothetical protein QVD17_00373 [Tagetes erecta]|uniref:Uncharacterized protein n=1 Tax=Tagetes erecta TaxID=13708 RepID=A0AAD8P0J6_TARER|nr:hypothetical protein QVD17_00373 [Tagetes erecta]